MFNFIKDIIAPKKCYSCQKEWHFLCPTCLSNMSNFEPVCYLCKKKSSNFYIHEKCREWVYYDQMIVVTHYRNKNVSKLIKHAKFYGKKDVLFDVGYFLSEILQQNYSITQDSIILWVPMTFLKKLSRGYNQSEIMAKYISQENNITYWKNILKKVKGTRQQSHLSRQEREDNLKNCFKINKNYIDIVDKKNIIIVDDVISTGTTLNEVSRVLKKNWANKVTWLCFASD